MGELIRIGSYRNRRRRWTWVFGEKTKTLWLTILKRPCQNVPARALTRSQNRVSPVEILRSCAVFRSRVAAGQAVWRFRRLQVLQTLKPSRAARRDRSGPGSGTTLPRADRHLQLCFGPSPPDSVVKWFYRSRCCSIQRSRRIEEIVTGNIMKRGRFSARYQGV